MKFLFFLIKNKKLIKLQDVLFISIILQIKKHGLLLIFYQVKQNNKLKKIINKNYIKINILFI